jgi:hypothetical protein
VTVPAGGIKGGQQFEVPYPTSTTFVRTIILGNEAMISDDAPTGYIENAFDNIAAKLSEANNSRRPHAWFFSCLVLTILTWIFLIVILAKFGTSTGFGVVLCKKCLYYYMLYMSLCLLLHFSFAILSSIFLSK